MARSAVLIQKRAHPWLPLQFKGGDSAPSLGIQGDEEFDLAGIEDDIKPQQSPGRL